MKKEKEIEKITYKLLSKMSVEAEVKVKEKEGIISVTINPKEEPGILIGHNGETLAALQQVLRLVINKQMGEFTYLLVDISGYKDRRRKELEEMAERHAQSAQKTKRVQLLVPMNSFERRIVHLTLAENKDVETESIGEEPNRRVMIRAKKKERVK